ncbi:MAG: 2,3-bisphosphoglycerate-independent phosphoglycerate mutase [Deltaproteobacteria bacterium]|nr:2,3-bisphosphoglycerate-independent phosphoglycerate mutase [Deltaproteobacteria bacterium]
MNRQLTLLCILDGLGLNPDTRGNAVKLAKTPVLDRLTAECPSSTLVTHGEAVGLPAGQMGNSEVGHLNIGAGRVVEQWLLRISRALKGESLPDSEQYAAFVKNCQSSPKVHLVGLVSDGGVHSHIEHLLLLITRLRRDLSSELVIHVVTDGRDTAPNSAVKFTGVLLDHIADVPRCTIGSVAGRFYAMDRDKRWERTSRAFDAIAAGKAPQLSDPLTGIEESYAAEVSDEFIEPFIVAPSPIAADDGIVFWNFREDRMRQIVAALALKDFAGFERGDYTPPPPSRVLCFTDYDRTFHLPFLFPIHNIKNHLGEVIAKLGLKQLRVAETEKYPHVTYFLNGGVEKELPGEERKLVPSPRDVKTYDLKPEMSAVAVTDIVVAAIAAGEHALIVVNLANCDMVGHTGNLDAAVKAVETVDLCLGRMVDALATAGGQALIIADHGNAEQMIDYETGFAHTAHTKYPVPIIMVGSRSCSSLEAGGALCDVAPTLLKMMGIPQPEEMGGKPLCA